MIHQATHTESTKGAQPLTTSDLLELSINGAVTAVAERPSLSQLNPSLRGVALSNSPVLIAGGDEQDRVLLATRLHALSRRSAYPLRLCRSPSDAHVLLKSVLGEGSTDTPLGTWVIDSVRNWPEGLRLELERALARVDESRLHGRLRHEHIPRVVVLESDASSLQAKHPDLHRRLSYFRLSPRTVAAEVNA